MAKSSARARVAVVSTGTRAWYPSDFAPDECVALDEMLWRHMPWSVRAPRYFGTDLSRRPAPSLVGVESAEFASRVAYAFDQRIGFGALSRFDDDEPPARIKAAGERLRRALRVFNPWGLFALLKAFEPEEREGPSDRAVRRHEARWRESVGPQLAEWLVCFRARTMAAKAVVEASARIEALGASPLSSFRGYAERTIAEDRDAASAVVVALDRRLALLSARIAITDDENGPGVVAYWGNRRRGVAHRQEALAVLHAGLSSLGFGQREIAALVLESSTWMVPPCPRYVAAKSQRDGDPKDRIAWAIGKDLRGPGKKRAARGP